MRTIKFRGKRIDKNEWCYGYYYIDLESKHAFIMLEKQIQSPDEWVFKSIRVIPETVGQFTGLLDKNSKEIYEKDIVKCSSGCPHTVEWVKEHGGTFFGGMPTWYLSGLNTGYAWSGDEELIGNTTDTPELLTV